MEVTGGGQAGSRIEVRMPAQKGQLVPFIEVFTKAGSDIVSVSITSDQDGEHAFVDLKERGGDEMLNKTRPRSNGKCRNLSISTQRPRPNTYI